MQPKHHVILYTFLGMALVIAGLLSVSYLTQARAAENALEDAYTRRVLEAEEHLQSLSLKLAKAPLAEGAAPLTELLTGVSRQADAIVTELSALPLSHIAMSDTLKFCNQLSEYTLALSLTAAETGALTEEDLSQLARLQQESTLLLGQFVTARGEMLSQSLRLATSENVYYQEAQLALRPLEQVADKDSGMDYPSLIYDGAFSDARHNGEPKALTTEVISAEQAVEIAVRFVGAQRVQASAQSVETEGPLAAYGVSLTLLDGTQLNLEITKRGGQPLWMMPEHASFVPSLTLEECEQAGRAFLTERGYGEVDANHYQLYDGLAVINFVPVQQEVLLYPDLLKLQVRMDTGEVVGFEGNNYLMNHVRRKALSPALTADDALARVSSRLKAESVRLCLIPYRAAEKLCWEVRGTYQDEPYLVYIDAATGEQAELLKVIQTGEGVLSA
ncbi:MAG: germination protein YpeB [Eubacteriales bacterium]|nr:germination protein YpeB [Eubacteriales bacterium]